MSNEQKPSVEAMACAGQVEGAFRSLAYPSATVERIINTFLARVRREARAEAFEDMKQRIQAIKGRPSAYEVECFGASSRKGGTWIERYMVIAAIDEALAAKERAS